jgi:sortase A
MVVIVKKYYLSILCILISACIFSSCSNKTDKNSNTDASANSETTTDIYDNSNAQIWYTPSVSTSDDTGNNTDSPVTTTVSSEIGNNISATDSSDVNTPAVTTVSGKHNPSGTVTTKAPVVTSSTERKTTTATTRINQPSSIKLSNISMPAYGEKYANVVISSVGINLGLYFGDTSAILSKGLGQYTGSSIPGFGRKTIICGHTSDNFLGPLRNISIGDKININADYGSYSYKIYKTEHADITGSLPAEYKNPQYKDALIMYTCYPFGTKNYTTQRFFVYAQKISGPDIIA